MGDQLLGFLSALDVTGTGARTREEIFTGVSPQTGRQRVFGGLVLAQALMAATRTTDGDRAAHSVHGYFLRAGDTALPITYGVDRIHDGRSFSTRRTQAYQNGVPIFSMIASFQVEDGGIDHQLEPPAGILDPASLAELSEDFDEDPGARGRPADRGFEFRYALSRADGDPVARQAVWIRCLEPLPDDPSIHRAALLYASDWVILEAVRNRHGVSWTDPGVRLASLDHAMWWHRPARADEWLLYTQESPNAHGGRGLGLGYMFGRDGELVATIAQEGMIRVPVAERPAPDPATAG